MVTVVLIAYYVEVQAAGVILAVAFLILGLLIYRLSPEILLRWYGARAMPAEQRELVYSYLLDLSSRFDVPLPRPYVFDSYAPVTFTVGAGKKYYLLVSSSSLDMLTDYELRSLLTLELAKISEGSVSGNSIVAFLAGTVAAFSTIAMWMSMLMGFGQKEDPAPRLVFFFIMGLVSLPCAIFVNLFAVNSRMKTDRIAAGMMEEPHLLAAVLDRTGSYIQLHDTDGFNPGHAHLFSVNPLKANTVFDVYNSMFLTKPGIRQRLVYLGNIDAAK